MKCTGKKIGNRDEKTDQKNGRNRKQKIAGCNAVRKTKFGSNWTGRAQDREEGDHEGQAAREADREGDNEREEVL